MRVHTPFIVFVWASALVVMFAQLFGYGAAAGTRGPHPATLHEVGALEPAGDGRWTLIVFAHPRCPCTRATMEEFKRFHGVHRARIATTVVLYAPDDADAAWTHGAIASSIGGMGSVRTVTDPGGVLARRFGVFTSGHVLAYDETGTLRYSGGITTSRGHEGRSDGTRALARLVGGGSLPADSGAAAEYTVFGCPLHDADALCFDKGCVQ